MPARGYLGTARLLAGSGCAGPPSPEHITKRTTQSSTRKDFRHRRCLDHRSARLHAGHGPRQGCHQIRGRMDIIDRPREPRRRSPQGGGKAVVGVKQPKWDERRSSSSFSRRIRQRPGTDLAVHSGQTRAGRCPIGRFRRRDSDTVPAKFQDRVGNGSRNSSAQCRRGAVAQACGPRRTGRFPTFVRGAGGISSPSAAWRRGRTNARSPLAPHMRPL